MTLIALIEDSDADYSIYQHGFLKNIPHVRYRSMEEFKRANVKSYSAVITDLGLPDCFGIETVKDVASVYEGEIFVLTGLAGCLLTGVHCHKMINAGAADVFTKDHLSKPIYVEIIRNALLKTTPIKRTQCHD